MRRPAGQAILADCPHERIPVDVAWPPFLLQRGFAGTFLRVEVTELGTRDPFGPEIIEVGDRDAWLRLLDVDPRRWAHRLDLARQHVEAMIPFAGPDTRLDARSG